MKIFEEDKNVEVFMEDDDGKVTYMGNNRDSGLGSGDREDGGNRREKRRRQKEGDGKKRRYSKNRRGSSEEEEDEDRRRQRKDGLNLRVENSGR